MLVALIGESCTGKSTAAETLGRLLNAEIFTGKDYLRLAKNEAIAQKLFVKHLESAVTGDHLIYVIAELEHLSLLPEGTVKVLFTADLELILERFANRMHGTLPPPVKTMLERKHGIFDKELCDYHIHNNENMNAVCAEIAEKLNKT